jgi:hypothetical protein
MAVAEPLDTAPNRAPVVYDAFISYSHAKDRAIASALQSVVQELGKAWYRRRALRVFRDGWCDGADSPLARQPRLVASSIGGWAAGWRRTGRHYQAMAQRRCGRRGCPRTWQ